LRVSQAQSQLPSIVQVAGLTVQKSLSSPLMLLAVSSPKASYDGIFLANYANINMVDNITRVKGVARVQVFGAGQYALRVWVKPEQLAKLGVTIPQITSALQVQNNVNPAGQIGGEPVPNGQQFTYTVRTQGRLVTEEEFGNIILRSNADGSVLHLRDVARLELGSQTYNLDGRYNGKPAAVLAIYQLPGSNAVQTAKNVRAELATLSATFPPDISAAVPLDTTLAVTAGIHEILTTLVIALVLVILVVYIFLQGWRATLIPLLAVPVSLIGTFIVFPMLGFSINTLSLFGLVLAIGLVVDDAIVVVEAVEHHIEEGMSPLDASYAAMEQVASPVIAIALILSAVFIPTAFIPGITGRLYQQFAVTIAISVIFSAFNALTLSPALCALLLKPKSKSKGWLQKFFDWFNDVFGRITNGYVSTSGWLVRKSIVAVVIILGVSALVLLVGKNLPGGFLPTEDQGYAFVSLQLPQGASASAFSPVSSPPITPSTSSPSSPGMSARARTSNSPPSRQTWHSRSVASRRASPSPSPRLPSRVSAPQAAFRWCWKTAPARPIRSSLPRTSTSSSVPSRRTTHSLRPLSPPTTRRCHSSTSMWTRKRCRSSRCNFPTSTPRYRPSSAARWSTTSTGSVVSGRPTSKPRATRGPISTTSASSTLPPPTATVCHSQR
jgi:HAE1 family hydrophobic/amphiphilic exporter-1